MKKRQITFFMMLAFIVLLVLPGCKKSSEQEGNGKKVTLVMGSWRVSDTDQINKILKVFHEKHPNIEVKFDPTTSKEYNAVLRTKLEGGTAPDVFYLRSYAVARNLYDEGFLENLTNLPGLKENYTEAGMDPWTTEDKQTYGVPFMAVSHGIYYNKRIFRELNLSIPDTWEELIEVAKKIKAAGITPFANGSKDEWTMAEIVFMNLAPNFIGGREGRLAYDRGERSFNDKHVVAAFQACKDLAPFLPKNQEALDNNDCQEIFLMEEAAMTLEGSWNINIYERENPDLEWGVFATPAPKGMEEHVTFHPDAAIGLNSASEHKEEAKIFLEWVTSTECATLLGNELAGFFPLNKNNITLDNEHANEFLALNRGRGLDVRWVWPVLLNGNPDGYSLIQDGTIAVIKGDITPQQAADNLQNGLAKWYPPAQMHK
ncbi:MAG: extracellular solute-binding protein [Spirochaetes bacterium]|nr:extracellular solute-binding protein [Spirochaetota bacterium]